jgi:Zn-dependent protease
VEKRWKVASIRGIPIHITVSWLFFAGIVVWITYQSLSTSSTLAEEEALWWSLVNAVLFYASIVLHELAHAATARAFDLPVHGITLVFWGGYTETHSSERGPLASFLIAAAGPLTTLVLAGVFWLGAEATDHVFSTILRNLGFLSLLFAGLNALPGFPVDGGRMLLGVVWGATKDRYAAMRIAGLGGLVVGVGLGLWALQILRSGGEFWLFLGFIAWMMISQGLQVARQAPVLRDLSTGRVSEAMRPAPMPIPVETTLLTALDSHLRGDRETEFPVVDPDGRVVGTLSFGSAAKVGGDDPTRRAADAMTPFERIRWVPPDLALDRAIESIAGSRQAVVLDADRRLLGRLTAEDVDGWYRRRILGSPTPGDLSAIPPRPDLG